MTLTQNLKSSVKCKIYRCKNCHKKFKQLSGAMFCSTKCRNKYHYKPKMFNCRYCNKKFKRTNSAVFCSKTCRKNHYNKNLKQLCLFCNTSKNLHEHHIQMQKYGGKNNGTVFLCNKHHKMIHKYYTHLENNNYKIVKI